MKQSKGVVAAGHPKTAEAAQMILEQGGNAYDAMIASILTSTLAEPVLSSLGGGGFMLSRTHEGKSRLFDFFVQTPKRKISDEGMDFYPVEVDFGTVTQEFHIGMASMATPGMVKGLFQVHERLGSLPFSAIIEPVVEYARKGIEMNTFQESIFDIVGEIYKIDPESMRLFGDRSKPGELIKSGQMFYNHDFADVLEMLAQEGPKFFYEGEISRKIERACESVGGHLTQEDLSCYKSAERSVLSIQYRGSRFITNTPPSSGGILIAFALKLLEETQMNSMGHGTTQHFDLLAQAMEKTNEARKEALDGKLYDAGIMEWFLGEKNVDAFRRSLRSSVNKLGSTTHISIIDGEGNLASSTVTNGEGSGYVIPGTGIMMNNMLGEEDLNPGGFHKWKEDVRISSMMSPSALVFGDRVYALGSGGSNRIRSAILQTVLNIVDFDMALDDAINRGRIHFERGSLNIENDFPVDTINGLQALYDDVKVWQEKSLFYGGCHGVAYDKKTVQFAGAGDRRRGGVSVVVG